MKSKRCGESFPNPAENSGTGAFEEFPPACPIAVVGMACRFPGAPSIPALWHLLESGGNAVREIPPGSGDPRVDELFSNATSPSGPCRFSAYVDGIDQFDPEFFRISPVEAQYLDPQQRMMLEISWEALEDAGIDPDRLKGTRTGVYTGISNDEYRMLVVDQEKPAEAAACLYALSGTNLNGTSGRVAFVLGLMGPAKAVDAACASSLVSVHDAVSDLQQGKADLAIAGGVQAILNGRIFELRADSMMLSADGQCKAFDASANGYVRGEGCGVVILKRLDEAQADGDRIWGVIRGAAVNHGGASSGLTVPNAPALEQVIEAALSQAGVSASQVDYLEAHGTGTSVGDPIELNAASAVYGRGRDASRPLLVGSIKTNVGHLESAAGIAGLIKAVLVMQQEVIPRHLHFQNPNPALDWERLPLRVTSSMMDLPKRNGRERLAGVNSFGISGTNAHIVLEEYSASKRTPHQGNRVVGLVRPVPVCVPASLERMPDSGEDVHPRDTRLLPLSAKSASALRELAGRYLTWLDQHSGELVSRNAASDFLLSDMAWTAGMGRSHFDHRSAVVFSDAGSLREQLEALAAGPGTDERPRTATRIAFAYTGQGSQWAGMGLALYEQEPVARAVLERCEKVFRDKSGTSLLDVMFGRDETGADLGDTAWEQPALYALECALTALWASAGIRPDVVLGHSVGELAAAQAAGVFSLEDGMRFARKRGILLSKTEPGGMAAVFAPPERVASLLEPGNTGTAGLSISAYNGSHQVLSGRVEDIEAVTNLLKADGVRVSRLNTARAFHSALVEPVLDELEASLEGVAIELPSITVISNLTGRAVESGQTLDGAYWKQHAREAVAFADGVQTLAELGVDLVVEIGPRPVLTAMTASAWTHSTQTPPISVSSLHPPSGNDPKKGCADFVQAVADVYHTGLPVHFEGLFAGEERRRISLPGYPFQRKRLWLGKSSRRRPGAGHALLGIRHDSASGETGFETELFPAEPEWMNDHQVFGRVIAPGALYGAMAASASLVESGGPVVVEGMQLHNALVFADEDADENAGERGRTVQVVLDAPSESNSRRVQIFSKGNQKEWTLHVEGRISPDRPVPEADGGIDLEALKSELSAVDTASYYRARLDTGIDLGPSFRTLEGLWSRNGEALGEVRLTENSARSALEVHPLLLDGCFQVVAAARNPGGVESEITYLPFGWECLWLTGPLPERVFSHVRMSRMPDQAESENSESAEVLSAEIRLYDSDGTLLGGLSEYTVKRATRASLLSAAEGIRDLLYEVVWQDSVLAPGMVPADFLPSPATVRASSGLLSGYLADEGVDREGRKALLADLEQWSRARALATLEELGWTRKTGDAFDSETLRRQLDVGEEHSRLFRRMLEMLSRSGILEEANDGFVVRIGPDGPLPPELPGNLETCPDEMKQRYFHGVIETALFNRSGRALAQVLRGQADPLTILFSSGDPTPADLYLKAPVARAANRILKETVQTLVADLPSGRRLRIIEVGAGTGSATAAILPELPQGRFDYMYTDISAGFFAEAESRFGDGGGCIEYRPLDIEKDPVDQGFDAHGYDLLIASNVLHATRYLEETLAHCLGLLAPSGQLVALENLSGLGWMDLTFGQLDGWWRFADGYRPHHALASPAVWHQALGDAGFAEAEVLGLDESDPREIPDKGVIVAQAPSEIMESPGIWILAGGQNDFPDTLASDLAARNQTVCLIENGPTDPEIPLSAEAGMIRISAETGQRDAWRTLIESLPADIPFCGIVHLMALDGHGPGASVEEMAQDVTCAGTSSLAMIQGMTDAGVTPEKGVWFITRGAQILEREHQGELAGSVLWGFGKAVAQEASHLKPRMIDLDPQADSPLTGLVNELLYPDCENHIAYRRESRHAARLVRMHNGPERLDLPDETAWALAPDPGGVFEKPCITPLSPHPLEPKEVRVAIEAAGLNFWDVFRSLGFIEEGNLGREMCGRILEIGSGVSSVSVGDHVVGLGFGAFAAQMVTREELVAPAPSGFSVTELATIPSAFVSAALSYELSDLKAGDRVLIHAGAGGVGLAAIQLAEAAGAEVFATASAPKQPYLRSLGVRHIFDSRQTTFGKDILDVTDGKGVDVVLNCLTGEGFIDASLACLAQGGRFVELARRDILTEDEMAAVRPDVSYSILELDVLKKTDPAWVGKVLRGVMEHLSAGELKPLVHSRWPLAETGAALRFMRSARHIGKIVVTAPSLGDGGLRKDRTYLVTGGLGGIGCAVAGWLAEHGAGTIVLNGRRSPDPEIGETIESLRERGFSVEVELADVTDLAAVDEMLGRIDRNLPPLGGVIHSVGVLSDGALANQNWDRFETVLWPKVLGAWHLHRATMNRNLDLFILFSSRVGVMGNPGQANHAAANAFLDQLAGHRRALGLPGQAIAWGAWSEIGEAAEQKERIERQRAARGGRWFTPRQGLKALDRLVRQDVTNSVVMSMDWDVFEEAVEERPLLLEELLSTSSSAADDGLVMAEGILSRLGQTPPAERESLLVSFLQQELQAVLRLPSLPEPAVGFFDLGMDSLMAVELRNRLNRAFADEYTVSNTMVFDYPDIASLARHLDGELGDIAPAPSAPPAPAPRAQPEAQQRSEPESEEGRVAIVGMACRFPGSPDLAAFWRLLEQGGDAITDGRKDSGPWSGAVGDPAHEGAIYRHGGFVEGLDRFDADFFSIRPIEARMMDPRQRLLLETSWQAVEDAGIDPGSLRGSRTGVYAGLGGSSEYRDLVAATGQDDGYLGTAGSVAIGRIAFAMGLMGPAVPLDMTCASSLVAVHQAAAALRQGDADLCLAGGVHATLSPSVTRFMAEFGMLSKSGKCRTFDADADGFVRGEGCGMIVLKRLRDAQADGDRIWGVIGGSAVNQSGASAALTVPNGPAQEQVLREALSRSGIPPSEVDYLEVHATGSKLGDPIEVGALAKVYGEKRDRNRPLWLGTVKTNIGHLEPAAGIAGLIKVALSMKHGIIPRHLNCETPNPDIDWDALPVRVATESIDWPTSDDRPPRAGVSAFALSGTNAHLVVEGYAEAKTVSAPDSPRHFNAGSFVSVKASLPEAVEESPPTEKSRPRGTRLLPLSGKSGEALRELSGRYLCWLDGHSLEDYSDDTVESILSEMAWTASVGRDHFPYRAGVVFRDVESLRRELRALAESSGFSKPRPAGKTAFVFADGNTRRIGSDSEFCQAEPVMRSVLDYCDAIFRDEQGASLLDAMLNGSGNLDDPAWTYPAVYALDCAITALWSSIGVRPNAVLGTGPGEIAAAHAAGVFTLGDGLRLAARYGALVNESPGDTMPGSPDDILGKIVPALPSILLVNPVTARALGPGETLDSTYWSRHAHEPAAPDQALRTLAEFGTETVVGIGMSGKSVTELRSAWPALPDEESAVSDGTRPRVVLLQAEDPSDDTSSDRYSFAGAAAEIYEAGLPLDFTGLFAGEKRSRISVPGYPFQGRSFWFEAPG